MRTTISFVSFIFLVLTAVNLHAMPIDLGTAGEFNAFFLGDMTGQNSDVEGRLAVGGNLQLQDYGIGRQLSNSHGTRDDLVVGGQINFKNGRIYNGNARSSDTTNPFDNSVGFYSDDPNSPNGRFISGNPVDFDAAATHLNGLSSSLSALSGSGTKSLNSFGELFLTGTAALNVFTLTDEELANVSAFYIDAPVNANVIVNVSGEAAELSQFGFFRNSLRIPDNDSNSSVRYDGSLTEGVLFNFFEALTLDIFAIGVKGSILAPQAMVNFFDGHIDGQLVAASFKGGSGEDLSGQINNYKFKSVPEPAALILILVGLTVIVKFRRGRRSTGVVEQI